MPTLSSSASPSLKAPVQRTRSRLHICFVCNELPPAPAGGIGPCVLTTAKQLSQLGHAVTVVGVYDADHAWAHSGIQVRPLLRRSSRHSRLVRISRLMTDRIRLRRMLQQIHRHTPIDIVEWPDFEGLFLRPVPGITDVVRNHGPIMSHRLYGLTNHRPHIELLERHTLRAIDNWIGVSTWFMDEWLRITGAKPRRTTVLYNPVDCDLFKPDGQRRNDLIVYSGSLLERKGVFALARGARKFLNQLPTATLLFVGRDISGDARARILHEAGANVAPQIRFSDPMPQAELAGLFRQCTLFAMPSVLESFGNVWAEAMASGAPVVGSTLTCGPEVVPDGVAGMLADPNDPQDIANRVVQLMNDEALRSRLGAAGRQIALERYSTEVIMPKTVSFYHECLSTAAAT